MLPRPIAEASLGATVTKLSADVSQHRIEMVKEIAKIHKRLDMINERLDTIVNFIIKSPSSCVPRTQNEQQITPERGTVYSSVLLTFQRWWPAQEIYLSFFLQLAVLKVSST